MSVTIQSDTAFELISVTCAIYYKYKCIHTSIYLALAFVCNVIVEQQVFNWSAT